MPPLVPSISKRIRAIRVTLIDRIAIGKPVQVFASLVANRIAVDKLAGAGVVVAVGQAQQPRLGVRVVPKLTAEAHRVVLRHRRRVHLHVLAQRPVPLVDRLIIRARSRCVGVGVLPLDQVALGVKGKAVGLAAAFVVAGAPAVGGPAVEGLEACRRVAVAFLGDQATAVVEEVGRAGGGGLSDAEAVAVVGCRERRAADAGQAVFRVEAERGALVSRRVAAAVEVDARNGNLVVGVRGQERRRVCRAVLEAVSNTGRRSLVDCLPLDHSFTFTDSKPFFSVNLPSRFSPSTKASCKTEAFSAA